MGRNVTVCSEQKKPLQLLGEGVLQADLGGRVGRADGGLDISLLGSKHGGCQQRNRRERRGSGLCHVDLRLGCEVQSARG